MSGHGGVLSGYGGERGDSSTVSVMTETRRDRYLDLWRAAALIRVVIYHIFGWVWLTVLFPAMGLMFALAGSLMAASLDRGGSAAVGRRLRRLLPPLWAFGVITVGSLLVTGWRTPPPSPIGWAELAWWIVPLRTPVVGEQSWAWAHHVVLWYLVTYLWLVLLSPALLRLYRRRPASSLVGAAVLPMVGASGLVTVGGYFADQVANVCTYLACWLLGFAHHDGMLRRIPARRYTCGVIGLAALGAGWVVHAALTTGTFDLNRIPVGNTLWSLAFVATVLRFRPRLAGLDRISPLRRAVALLNARAVTVYLWHLPAGYFSGLLLAPVTPESGFGMIAVRLVGVVAFTAVAVLAFGWVEDLAARRRPVLLPAASVNQPRASESRRLGEVQAADETCEAPRRPPANAWHRALLATVVGCAAGLSLLAYGVVPGVPRAGAGDTRTEVTRYLSDLLVVLDDVDRAGVAATGPVPVPAVLDSRAIVSPAPNRLRVQPPPGCARLLATIRVADGGDDSARVAFAVRADEVTVYESGARTRADDEEQIEVDISSASWVDLVTSGTPGGATGIWADARLLCTG
jgi:peptidoglycan/LPS O-acetylase OafA/YrhL